MTVEDFRSKSLAEGLSLERTIQIGENRVITFMGNDLRVYETPSMIADIEYACRDLLYKNLPDGWDSVGVVVNIEHLAATPMLQEVRVDVEIEEILNRRVRFKCEVHDAVELVGRGMHERFIVEIDKHRGRVMAKRENMQELD